MFFNLSFVLYFFLLLSNVFAVVNTESENLLLSIAQEEEVIKENKINIDEVKDGKTTPETRICLYTNGATVNMSMRGEDIQVGNNLLIKNLSDTVSEKSIVVRCPDAVLLQEYQLVDPVKDPKKKEKIENNNSKNLELNVYSKDKLNLNDLWNIQYSVKKIYWTANHIIEFTSDREHIMFETTIRVSNRSGIDFKNAHIQFLDQELPDEDVQKRELELGKTTVSVNPSLIYQSSELRDLLTNQEKAIVWSNAKRVTISTSNGLFVGGKYLQKMNSVAYPQIENWISFPNIKEVGLGKPLPNGKVAVYYNNDNYISLVGFTTMNQVRESGDVTIRMPSFTQYRSNKTNDVYSSLTAHLTQESYRSLTPTMAEARYKLSLQNLKNTAVSLMVTVDCNEAQKCSVARENMKHKKNKHGEPMWVIEIPPKGSKELRYELTIKNRL